MQKYIIQIIMKNRKANKLNKIVQEVDTAIILSKSNCRIIPLKGYTSFRMYLYCSDNML